LLYSDRLFAAFSIGPALTGLDRHPKGRDSALQHIETGSQLRYFDALDDFLERPFDTLQDGGDESGIKRHTVPLPRFGSV
jgi:hypothetical protein